LSKDEIIVGREAALCDIVLDVKTISGCHFKIIRELNLKTGSHDSVLQDTSTNGSWHNGELIKKNQTAVLQDGDKVGITISTSPFVKQG
jgi:hypothetical protein